MKHILAMLLSAALLLGLLPACNPQGVQPSDPPAEGTEDVSPAPTQAVELTARELVEAVCAALEDVPEGLEALNAGEDGERLGIYVENAYGLATGVWEDAAILRATGASAVELAVLRFPDEDAARRGEDCLRDYLHTREGDFTGYAPNQAKLVADAALCRQGLYVGLFICEGNDLAESAFTTIIETGKLPELPEPTPTPEPVQDAAALLDQLLRMCERYGDNTSDLERVDSSDPDRLKSIMEEEYGLADYPWTDAAVARGTGGSAFEIAVLHIDGDERTGMDAIQELNAYLDAKEEACARFPAQAKLLHEAMGAWTHGYIALLVCNQPLNIGVGLGSCLGYGGFDGGFSTMRRHMEAVPTPAVEYDPDYPDRIKFVSPGVEDMSLYDTSAIRDAWAGGDPSGLSEHDRATYDAAKAILDEVLADGMSGLEKETAIYHWIVNNVDYDWRHQDALAETPRESYEPYGGLVSRAAVCLGYAASFQLLAELSGLECITVVGAAFYSEEDHAWNMVRLDGNWYCVDVTWDANYREQGASSGGEKEWNYFNVTSDELAKNHQWDYANTPEAVTKGRGKG